MKEERIESFEILLALREEYKHVNQYQRYESNMKKKVFIIGNGFDLDLGWRTRFKDFVNSDYCPIRPAGCGSCPMEEYLARKIDIERWYDLECILREYAVDGYESHRKADPRDEFFSMS